MNDYTERKTQPPKAPNLATKALFFVSSVDFVCRGGSNCDYTGQGAWISKAARLSLLCLYLYVC